MGITASEIQALAARYGNERVQEQENLLAPFLGKLDKVNLEGQVGVINIKGGGLDSTLYLADGAQLPNGANKQPEQALYPPKYLFSRLSVPRGGATLATGKKDGINIVFEQLDTMGAHLALVKCRGFIDKTLYTLDAADATELGAAGTTLTAADFAGFRVGQVVERRDSSNTLEEYMRVTKVVIDADGSSHVLTLVRNVDIGDGSTRPNGAPATGDKLYQVGAYANGTISLGDAADETTDIYGHDADTNSWMGNALDQGGAFDVQGLRDVFTKTCIRGGQLPDFTLCNSRRRQTYSDTLLSNRRYIDGKMDATGGVEIEFEGKPVCVDESAPNTKMFLVKKADFKIHVFKEVMDEADGGMKAPSNTGHMIVGQTNFDYDEQRWGAFEARIPKRNNLGVLTGITG